MLRTRLQQYRDSRPEDRLLVSFAEALRGGHPERGRRVVFGNAAAQCTRCHAFQGPGPDVGPPLGRIGAVLSREQLLEALVDPSARIAPGYATVVLTLRSGPARPRRCRRWATS